MVEFTYVITDEQGLHARPGNTTSRGAILLGEM